MLKTNEELRYEKLAKEVVKESVAVNAQIPVGKRQCTIEIQLAPDDSDPIRITFDLPKDDDSIREDIRSAVRNSFFGQKR